MNVGDVRVNALSIQVGARIPARIMIESSVKPSPESGAAALRRHASSLRKGPASSLLRGLGGLIVIGFGSAFAIGDLVSPTVSVVLLIGGTVMFATGGLRILEWSSSDPACLRELRERMLRDAEGGVLNVTLVRNISDVVPIHDVEGFGPGYLLLTREGEGIFLCSPLVPEAMEDFTEQLTTEAGGSTWPEVLGSEMEIQCWPHSGELHTVRISGGTVPVRSIGMSVNELPVELTTPFRILSDATVLRIHGKSP